MTFINLKLKTAISAAFILAVAGTCNVQAQTTVAPVILTARESAAVSGMMDPNKIRSSDPVVTPVEAARPTAKPKVDDIDQVVDVTDSVPVTTTKANPVALPPTRTRPQAAADDEWQFQFTPYLWLAGLHGTTGTNARQVGVDASFGDVFDKLKFALMGTFEARRGKFGIVTDFQYVSLDDDEATPGPLYSGVDARVKTFIFDPEVAYRLIADPEKGAFLDVMGGIRVVKVSTELTFFTGFLPGFQLDASRTWVDGVVGMRAKAHLSPKVFVVGKFDVGGGGSNFTYQLLAAGGYQIRPTIALLFGYRALDINYRKDNFVYDTNQRGPILGVGFKF